MAIEVETPRGWRPHLHGGVPEDDSGLAFLTLAECAERASTPATRWCSYWLAPADGDRSAVERLRGDVLHSPGFELGAARAPADAGCGEPAPDGD